jgi:hypothetical protein
MGGRYINRKQVDLYMTYRKVKGLTQKAAAAKVGISVRSGRNIEQGVHATASPPKLRNYKTRKSPIDQVWETELEPMLRANPNLQPKTLLIYLERTHRNAQGDPVYKRSIERTLQRHVAKWLALHGQPKEVMFPQTHMPGEQGLSDFTHFHQAQITIQGDPFKHMFYHFRLVYSKWDYLKVIQGGESMQALSEGLQEALFVLGGTPKEHRTDSLSAAFKNLSRHAKKDLTSRYEALCKYYNMIPTRNNKGRKHENGSVESAHGHLKNRMAQELLLRGSCDFESVGQYEEWVHGIVQQSNKRNRVDFTGEQLTLQPLPAHKTVDYEIKSIKVPSSAILTIKRMRYSIPSRLSGHMLTLHIYQQKIQVYLGSTFVLMLDRKYHKQQGSYYVIRYQDVIHALIKKPGAFRQCTYRDELLPNSTYRAIWRHVDALKDRQASVKLMLKLLKLAADFDCEEALGAHVLERIAQGKLLNIEAIESLFTTERPALPAVICQQHTLGAYDAFIQTSSKGAQNATT